MKQKFWYSTLLAGAVFLMGTVSAGAAQSVENEHCRVDFKTYAAGEKTRFECPVVTGISDFDQSVLDQVNQYLYDVAESELIYYAEQIQSSEQDLMEYNPEAIQYLTYEATCDSVYLKDNVLSVMIFSYANLGGAHGYGYPTGYSFDLNSGELLSMEALLGCDTAVMQTAVVEAYRKDIIDQVENITEDSIIGAFDRMTYWMKEDGMYVNIAPYEIASYAAGQQQAIVTPEILARALSGELAAVYVPQPGEMISVIGGIQAPASDFVLPMSSERALTWEDLAVLDGATVEEDHYWSQLAINEILARYGYVFNPEQGGSALEAYNQFEGLDWYEQAKPYCPTASANEMLYTYITSLELSNIDLICEWQKEHGCYY